MIKEVFKAIFRYTKILLLGAAVLCIFIYGAYRYLFRVPRFATYEEQVKFAEDRYNWAYWGWDMDNPIGVLHYNIEMKIAPHWRFYPTVRATKAIEKFYPEKVQRDGLTLELIANTYHVLGRRPDPGLEYYQKAIKEYERTSSKDSLKYYQAINRVKGMTGNCYAMKREFNKTIEEFKWIIERADVIPEGQTFGKGWYMIKDAFQDIIYVYMEELKDYESAIRWAKRTEEHDPHPLTISHAERDISECYIRMGQPEKAEAILRNLVDQYLGKEDPVIAGVSFYKLEKFLTQYNRYQELIPLYEKFIAAYGKGEEKNAAILHFRRNIQAVQEGKSPEPILGWTVDEKKAMTETVPLGQ